jgi:dynein heavy chain
MKSRVPFKRITGISGELTMSDAMEALQASLYLDRVPATWEKWAWPSLRPLGSWLLDMQSRLSQLEDWKNNPLEIPKVRSGYALSAVLN